MKMNGVNLITLQEKLIDKHYREIWEKVRNQLFDETTDMIIDLEHQLAEKDKEINKLSKEHFEMFGDMKDYKNLWLAEQRKNKELRHQVCQEIKHKVFEVSNYDGVRMNMDGIELLEILDQIEKGEKNE